MDISEQQQTQYPYQQPPPPSSSYDPSQSQSYEAYYAYHHHQQYYDPSSYPQQLYYDYSSTQTYPQPTQIHHPQDHQPAAAAMNPAAAAAMEALSQLSQFAGEMDAAEKAGMVYNPSHHQHYPMEHGHVSIQPGGSGGGRMGGGPFRGGGRRGGGGRGRGRGRGRGGGRKPNQFALNSQPTPAAVPTPAPPAPVLPVAWCDICRVECNSLEILEQHKNGKRHKKTAQRFEEIQKQQKLLAEYQAKFIPNTIIPSAVTENAAEVVEAKKVSAEPEIIPMAAVFSTQVGELAKASATDDNNAVGFSSQVGGQTKDSATNDNNAQVDGASKPYNAESEQNSESKGTDVELSTGPPCPNGYNRFDIKRGGGTKRKMTKYGRGGKRLKNFHPVPRRVRERPRACTLCNVMCESLVVFETHIAGKKHISKIKRCQGQGAVYGPITIYIPPNQPSAYPTQGQEPLFYGLKGREMIQQTTYMGMSGLQAEDYALHQVVQNSNAEGGVSEQQAMQGLETNGGKEVAIIDNTDPQDPANAPLVFESKEPNLSTVVPDNSEIDGAFNITEDPLPVSELDNLLGDDIVLSGVDAKVEQPTTNIEELNNAVESSIQ